MRKYRQFRQDQITKQEETIVHTLEEFRLDPGILEEYMKFAGRFYQYSARNKLLIYNQNPAALFCASYQGFLKMGYHVRRGEKGMDIMVPVRVRMIEIRENGRTYRKQYSNATDEEKRLCDEGHYRSFTYDTFKVGKVFDIAQTDCPKEDYPKYLDLGDHNLEYREAGELIKDFAREILDVRVIRDDMSSVALRGEFNLLTNTIRTNEKYEDTSQLSILTHELGHALLHRTIEDMNILTCEREFQADCVSILLMKHFGFDVPILRLDHAVKMLEDMKVMCERFDLSMLDSMQKAINACAKVTDYVDLRRREREDPVMDIENERSFPDIQGR